MTYQLRIAHLYPEQMNIYGDRGNILALLRRCAWRGIGVEPLSVGVGLYVDWEQVDIAFFGGGQDSGQALIAEDFVLRHGPALRAAKLLGHYFLTYTSEQLPGIGALDLHTVGGDVRLIGNIVVEADLTTDHRPPTTEGEISSVVGRQSSVVRLVGFENHSGRTYLGAGVRPLGRVLAGHGNNGEDGTEGVVYRNVFGCYMHGSLLPKNPQLADHLIGLALARRYGSLAALTPLHDDLELAAQRTMVERLVRG